MRTGQRDQRRTDHDADGVSGDRIRGSRDPDTEVGGEELDDPVAAELA
jgi:hypothetical protein